MDLDDKLRAFQAKFGALPIVKQRKYVERLNLEYTHHSTAIEGNTLTLHEAESLLKEGLSPGSPNIRELYDVVGHDRAVRLLRQLSAAKTPISEEVICRFHRETMHPGKFAGRYRTFEVCIGGALPAVTPSCKICCEMLLYVCNLEKLTFTSPLEKAAFAHAQLVKIHPFADGNGRTSRLVMNLSLMNDGYPLLNIKRETAKLYLAALNEYGENGNLAPLISFLEGALHSQLTEFLEGFK